MNEHLYFNNIKEFESIMISILNEGEKSAWENIEREKDAFKRCSKRKMYWSAIEKIKKGK